MDKFFIMEEEMQEVHIEVKGLVQGIGFRAVIKRHALLHNIKGFARNCADGSVEICAQGTKDQISHFLSLVEKNSGAAKIEALKAERRSIRCSYDSFEIL